MGRNIALTTQTVGMTGGCQSRFSGLSCNGSGDRDDERVKGVVQFGRSVRPWGQSCGIAHESVDGTTAMSSR